MCLVTTTFLTLSSFSIYIITYEIDEVDKKEVASGQRPESRRGKFAPVYERVYNHYATRLGLGMPYVKEVLETKVRPENAGTDIAHLGYGTFLYCSEGFE